MPVGRWKRTVKVLGLIALMLFAAAGGWCVGRVSVEKDVQAVIAEASTGEVDAIAAFRTEREQLRAMQKAQLNEIVHSDASEAEIAALAQRQLMDICSREEHELTLEGLLALRGFDDPLVTVQSDSANVLLRTQMVTQQECSIILDLVCRETGVQSGNVKIIPIN